MYLVLRQCACKTGYVGSDGHSCPRCEGNLEYEAMTSHPRPDDEIIEEMLDDEADY